MNPRKKLSLIAAVAVPLLFVAVILLQARIDETAATELPEQEELLVSSPTLIKKLSLGYDALVADVYWTRAVQYYGSRAGIRGSQFPLLWPLLDITTTLDSKLIPAYRFGAIFLSEPPPVGAGEPELALKLTQKGIAANPDDWQMNATEGFLYYWYLREYQKSSEAYLAGSKNPAAPGWLAMMAAQVVLKADETHTSQMIWSEIYNSSTDASVRANALQHLKGLQATQDLKLLDDAAQKYRSAYGHFPATGEALVQAGIVRSTPVDPSGFPYIYDADGVAHLNPESDIVILSGPVTPPDIYNKQ
jgi:tetratricopeptide (TPR) repeat protein